MQLQSSWLGEGGSGEAAAAQALLTVGQAATLLVGEYEALLTPDGETVAMALLRLLCTNC